MPEVVDADVGQPRAFENLAVSSLQVPRHTAARKSRAAGRNGDRRAWKTRSYA